MEKTMEKTAE
jgi:dynein heavy chain